MRVMISHFFSGVFSWITVNYLLGRFDHTESPTTVEPVGVVENQQQLQEVVAEGADLKKSTNNKTVYTINTVGSLDMGGASLQVAFEIPHNVRKLSTSSKYSSFSVHVHVPMSMRHSGGKGEFPWDTMQP